MTLIFDRGVSASVQLYVVTTWRAELPRSTRPVAFAAPCRLNRSIEPAIVPDARTEPEIRLRGIAIGVSTWIRGSVAPLTARATSVCFAMRVASVRAARTASAAMRGRGRTTPVSGPALGGRNRANVASESIVTL